MLWFTSDQHYGHKNVILYCNRPFADIEAMNAELIRRHNAVVAKEDVVIHLGDFSLSRGKVGAILRQLNGIHDLILGNHDSPHPCHHKKGVRTFTEMERYRDFGFRRIEVSRKLYLGLTPVELHHMPPVIPGDSYAPRYPEYRPIDAGQWILHGHVHQHWKQRGRWINVGVDVWDYAPVSEASLLALIGSDD